MIKETMTSRERVYRAIRHQPVDRMPIDLGSHYSTGISAFAYWNLREYLGLDTDTIEICDPVQFLARVDEDILRRFHCDCLLLHAGWSKTKRWNVRGKYTFTVPQTMNAEKGSVGEWLVTRNEQHMRMPEGGFFFDGAWPNFDERSPDEYIRTCAVEAERIYKETDFATMFMYFGGYFSEDADWLCSMLTDPDDLKAANEKRCQEDLKRADQILKAMDKHIQIICLNSDLGTQNGPMCRPSSYEEICAPYVKRLCKFIHENSDCKILLHSCGSIKSLIPIFIDSGIDILNPVQISAQNMKPSELNHEFGAKIAFWGGGCNTQEVLWQATPAGVSENVKELAKVFKRDSGFVFNQVHNVMGDVPPENIVAMLDTAYAESAY